jgi:hypothetical protein
VLPSLNHLYRLIIECVLCFGMKSVDYDTEGSVLRVRGNNITENDHVKVSDSWLNNATVLNLVKLTSFFLNEDRPAGGTRSCKTS